MNKAFLAILPLLVMICTALLSAQEVRTLKAGVVKITAEIEGDQEVGTGFIVQLTENKAYIVTASHVVEGDSDPKVEFFTQRNEPVSASVIGLEGGDPKGLAVLLVIGKKNIPSGLSALPPASVSLQGGEDITVIGHPLSGASWSVIKGNYNSRKGNDILFSGAIQKGNSGGPIIREGKVIGLVTRVASPYSYATPTAIIQNFLDGWEVEWKPFIIKVSPSPVIKYLVGIQAVGLDSTQFKDLVEKVQALGYEIYANASANHQQPPKWMATEPTVFYYAPSAKSAAEKLAAEMRTLTGKTYDIRVGAGLAVDDRQRTLFVHVYPY